MFLIYCIISKKGGLVIKDSIDKYVKYCNLSKNIQKGFEFILKTNFENIPDGKYDMSESVYMNVQTYTTKQDADFEAHRIYIDIQYIIDGEENIEVTPYSYCESSIAYDENKDIEFLSGTGKLHNLKKGDFMILFPEDAHKPSLAVNNPQKVRKAVVKVKI